MRLMGMLLGALLSWTPMAQAQTLVVVELFQSQGCSSCPPAIANLNAIADRAGVLALNLSVTYWDNLGWKDTFASAAFTNRQYDYAHGLGHANVATPEIVINGRTDLVGADRAALERALQQNPPAAASLSLHADFVAIGAAAARKGDVWLVRYDPRPRAVSIRAGENGGKTIIHRNIVRELTNLGAWSGAAQSYKLPPVRESGLKSAILVQAPHGGAIIAAASDG